MRLDRVAALPAYIDGCFTLYDIVDDGERKIRPRPIAPVWFRELAVYDRTRVTFEQADLEVTRRISIPQWDGISSNCVCVIDGVQHKVFNKADVITKQGCRESELTLVSPAMDYEVIT